MEALWLESGAQREEATRPVALGGNVADRAERSLLGTFPRSDTEHAASWDIQTLRSIRKSHLWGEAGAQGRGRPHSLPLCIACAGLFPRCDLILLKTLKASGVTHLWAQSSVTRPRSHTQKLFEATALQRLCKIHILASLRDGT